MYRTHSLAGALLLTLALAGTAQAESPPQLDPTKLDPPRGPLTENDIQLAEYELLATPYAELEATAAVVEGTGMAEHRRWQAYATLIRRSETAFDAGVEPGPPVVRRGQQVLDGCPAGDLPCLSAFWNGKDWLNERIPPEATRGSLLVAAGGSAAAGTFAVMAGIPALPALVVFGGVGTAAVVTWKVLRGMSPEDEAARYGHEIDTLLGRSWIQRTLNGYKHTFRGVLRVAWALRDAEDGVVRQQARRILLLEGANQMTDNCPLSLASLWDKGEACKGTVVARHMAWRSFLSILGYQNQKLGWGLNIKGTIEDGKVFQRYFPSLGENQHAPAGGGSGGVFGVTSFG
jgi:hypothetical protein